MAGKLEVRHRFVALDDLAFRHGDGEGGGFNESSGDAGKQLARNPRHLLLHHDAAGVVVAVGEIKRLTGCFPPFARRVR